MSSKEKKSELMQGLEIVRVYFNDLLCLMTMIYEDHLLKVARSTEMYSELHNSNLIITNLSLPVLRYKHPLSWVTRAVSYSYKAS